MVNVAELNVEKPLAEIPPDIAETICSLLHSLLGEKVTSVKVPAFPLARRAPRITAAYLQHDDSVLAICVCDLPFAAYAGAALLMVPVGTAKECIFSGKCTPELLGNVAEILNILRQCFESPGQHVAAERLYNTQEQIPAPIAAIMVTPRRRLDLEITIAGYGNGRLSIVV